jgi:hypothetical protein
MEFRDQTFTNQRIELDNNAYTGCTFDSCVFVYSGGPTGRFSANRFKGKCRLEFDGPALSTIHFMQWANDPENGGMKDAIDQWIKDIQQPWQGP